MTATKRFRMPAAWRRNPAKEARVDELLRIVQAFAGEGRGIPGHILRELVQLQLHWGKREIPAAAVAARKVQQ